MKVLIQDVTRWHFVLWFAAVFFGQAQNFDNEVEYFVLASASAYCIAVLHIYRS